MLQAFVHDSHGVDAAQHGAPRKVAHERVERVRGHVAGDRLAHARGARDEGRPRPRAPRGHRRQAAGQPAPSALSAPPAPAAPLAGAWAVAADVAWAAVRAALNLLPPETYAAAWRMLQS